MSDCCIYEPQNYDPQAVDRFLRGETREICIELKCVEQEKSEDFAITDAVLQLDLIKCREPHMCDVPAHNTPYFDPSGLAKLSFLITEKTVGSQDYHAICRCGAAHHLLGGSRLLLVISEGSESRECAFEFSPASGVFGKYVWHEVDLQASIG
ncbi:hypothetical protein [Collinsella aerofaciens]|uniref:hypothetical protein n=1 Tax=Collinsella aerofaciens TaxID=74426 RepID=UPI003D7B43A5